jgi:5'-deoxynucleotidase YfbR-like HD superfamily hydrolase
MKKLPHSETNSKNIALLEDRVLLKETGEQTYGTQFDEINGEFVPKPIKDPEHVDERRKTMGLDALKDGIEDMYEKYGKPLQEQGPKLIFAHLAPDAWAELGKLKRKGWVKRSVKNPETVQQHTISARIVALEIPDLSEMEKRELLDMLEIHDWPEAINGDQIVVEEDKIKLKQLKEDKFIAEREALTKICSELGGKGQEILDLWLKFELSDDEIASLARQIDKYQAVEKAFEYERAQKIPLFIEFLEYTKPFITHPVLLAKMAVLESSYNK